MEVKNLVNLLLARRAGRLGGGLTGRAGRLGSGLLLGGSLSLLLLLDASASSLGVDPRGVGVLEPDRVDDVDNIDEGSEDKTSDRLLLNGHGQEVQGRSEIHGVYSSQNR